MKYQMWVAKGNFVWDQNSKGMLLKAALIVLKELVI